MSESLSTTKSQYSLPVVRLAWQQYEQEKSVHRVAIHFGVCGETIRRWFKRAGLRCKKSDWIEDDLDTLRAYYNCTPPKEFSLAEIAKRLGRDRIGVALKASRLGLGNRNRQKRERRAAIQRELPWSIWVKNPHPCGMAGKKHSPETLTVVAQTSRDRWVRDREQGTGLMSPQNRQRRSDQLKSLNRSNPKMRCGYSRCRSGRRVDLENRYFRSSWEANIARYFNWLVQHKQMYRWEYETQTFEFDKVKRGTRSYTPDFKVWDKSDSEPYFVEVKGWMDAKSRTRMKRMKRYHPAVRVDLLDSKRYGAISSQMSRLIAGWEK